MYSNRDYIPLSSLPPPRRTTNDIQLKDLNNNLDNVVNNLVQNSIPTSITRTPTSIPIPLPAPSISPPIINTPILTPEPKKGPIRSFFASLGRGLAGSALTTDTQTTNTTIVSNARPNYNYPHPYPFQPNVYTPSVPLISLSGQPTTINNPPPISGNTQPVLSFLDRTASVIGMSLLFISFILFFSILNTPSNDTSSLKASFVFALILALSGIAFTIYGTYLSSRYTQRYNQWKFSLLAAQNNLHFT